MSNANKFLMLVAALIVFVGCGKDLTSTITSLNGRDGVDGYSLVSKTTSNPSVCSNGGAMVFIALDTNRSGTFDAEDQLQTQFVSCNGANGVNGTNGLNGTSCTVSKVGSAATVTCGTSSAVIVDGSKGDKGDKGDTGSSASGIYISEVLNPCGSEFANEEVFLKLSNGMIIALYDGGPNLDRLVSLAPGNYQTTDRSSHTCTFTLTSSGQLTNQVIH